VGKAQSLMKIKGGFFLRAARERLFKTISAAGKRRLRRVIGCGTRKRGDDCAITWEMEKAVA